MTLYMGDPVSERLNLPISKSLIQAIDDWRRGEADLPSRSEAIRRLIARGLEAGKPPAPKRK